MKRTSFNLVQFRRYSAPKTIYAEVNERNTWLFVLSLINNCNFSRILFSNFHFSLWFLNASSEQVHFPLCHPTDSHFLLSFPNVSSKQVYFPTVSSYQQLHPSSFHPADWISTLRLRFKCHLIPGQLNKNPPSSCHLLTFIPLCKLINIPLL